MVDLFRDYHDIHSRLKAVYRGDTKLKHELESIRAHLITEELARRGYFRYAARLDGRVKRRIKKFQALINRAIPSS
jgi:hypothetical protein